MTKAVLELRIRFVDDSGPEYRAGMTIDRSAVESCVLAAANRPDVGWRALQEHTHAWLRQCLVSWAERAMPARVGKAREVDQLAEMLMSNLRRGAR